MTPVVANPHPYFHLTMKQKGAVARELKEMEDFAIHFRSAAEHISKNAEISDAALRIVNALDERAAILLNWQDPITPWRKEWATIQNITWCLSHAQKGFVIGGGSALVVSLLHRSNRLFMVASLCTACAFLVLKSIAASWEHAFLEIGNQLEKLSWSNQTEFSQKVAAIYAGLSKASYLTRVYLSSQSTKSMELLKEQLFAFKNLKSLVYQWMGVPFQVKVSSEKDTIFFKKFAEMTRRALFVGGGMTLFAAGWTYYAFMQRVYFMTCVGVVHVVAALAISRELFVLQRCSRKICEAEDEAYTQACLELIQQSRFVGRLCASPETLRGNIVEPLDAILNLVPSWKKVDAK